MQLEAKAGEDPPPPCVYIVDDDRELCASLEWLVGSVGLESHSFTSATAFLEAFDPERIACLIVDVRMPEISGFRLQEILNERREQLPVIFVSAHGDIKMSVRALQQGAVTFIEKPYEPQHMIDVVQDALASAREMQEGRRGRARIEEILDSLTPREREVLRFVIEGEPSKVVAHALGISTRTVDVHRTRIREKSGAPSLAVLVRDILQSGVDLEALEDRRG
ncbi:MAG: DNA-binding response regulator [Candidatus Leucobacter sulfamidivorax]|nr:DNA-binding response regulator [Candidatus Leucobacter sulfamidivorax]